MRKKIFILADWFSPGYKAGGLVTALANLTQAIGEHFELFVMTRDRDLGDSTAYRDIASGTWVESGHARVFYANDFSFGNLGRQIQHIQPDVLYLNSFFSTLTVKALLLRRMGFVAKTPVVIAPRGELSPGALAIKGRKKSLYSTVALRSGLYGSVRWHASSDLEAREIRGFLESRGQRHSDVVTASDIPPAAWTMTTSQPVRRTKRGSTRFLFVSRISPKKNLLYALEALRSVASDVEFDLYGPIDDANYWADCERAIRTLPTNVSVSYRGPAAPDNIAAILRDHDFFLLPTQGENFGYAILEALAEGCPVLISDRTPWNDVAAQGAGWAIPLEDRGGWARAIDQCIAMDAETYLHMSSRARQYLSAWLRRTNPSRETIEMFESVLAELDPAPQQLAAERLRSEKQAYASDQAREAAK
jgi:glycosyltransferase involved in cell wall biosynthesis